jgi:micrococcal nuclease
MKLRICSLLIIISLTTMGAAKDTTYGDVRVSRVIRVYDGDTIIVDIDSWPAIIGTSISVRCDKLDTPEIRTRNLEEKKLGYRVRDFVKNLIDKAKVIELRNIRRDKYFRLLADIYIDGIDLGDILLKKGYARKYSGGKKTPWFK